MIPFHRFLIGTAIAFCAVFAIWAQVAYQSSGGLVYQVLSLAFALATLVLLYYLKNLRRFLGR